MGCGEGKKNEAFVVITQDAAQSVQAENAGAGSLEEPLLLSQKINTHTHTHSSLWKKGKCWVHETFLLTANFQSGRRHDVMPAVDPLILWILTSLCF